MRLPDRLEPPEQVVVCEICWRAGCWNDLQHCLGVEHGRPKRCITMTAEQVKDINYEEPSFWHGPRSADQAPRDVLELLDAVEYLGGLRGTSRDKVRAHLRHFEIDSDQVDAAIEQAWPVTEARV